MMRKSAIAMMCAGLCACSAADDNTNTNTNTSSKDSYVSKAQIDEPKGRVGVSYQVALEPGHSLEYFIDRGTGAVAITERGQSEDVESVLETDFDDPYNPIAAFLAYHPKDEIPSELIELEKVLGSTSDIAAAMEGEEAPLEPGAVAIDAIDNAPIQKHGTSSASHFATDHKSCWFGSDDVANDCRTNRSGGGWAAYDARWAVYRFASYSGTIRATGWMTSPGWNGTIMFQVNVPAGTWIKQIVASDMSSHDLPSCSWWEACQTMRYPNIRRHRAEVDLATGDSYHWSYRYHNYKVESSTCAMTMRSAPSVSNGNSFVCSSAGF